MILEFIDFQARTTAGCGRAILPRQHRSSTMREGWDRLWWTLVDKVCHSPFITCLRDAVHLSYTEDRDLSNLLGIPIFTLAYAQTMRPLSRRQGCIVVITIEDEMSTTVTLISLRSTAAAMGHSMK